MSLNPSKEPSSPRVKRSASSSALKIRLCLGSCRRAVENRHESQYIIIYPVNTKLLWHYNAFYLVRTCLTNARYLQDSVGESSLEDLSVINLLLDGPSSYKAVDGHLTTLSHAPSPLPCLKREQQTIFRVTVMPMAKRFCTRKSWKGSSSLCYR